jgi:hypothetical protein
MFARPVLMMVETASICIAGLLHPLRVLSLPRLPDTFSYVG